MNTDRPTDKGLREKNEKLQEQVNALKEENEHLRKIEETLRIISSRFVGVDDIDKAINESLADMGKLSGAGRAYLFLFRENESIMDNTHEWCATGVTPEIDTLQGIPATTFPWLMNKLRNRETIHIKDTSKLPAEANAEEKEFKKEGIKSLLIVPVYIKDRLTGFLGFDNVTDTRNWEKGYRDLLQSAAKIIVNAFEQKWANKKLRDNKENLRTTLDSIGDAVITTDTRGKIVRMNPVAQKLTGWGFEEAEGKPLETIFSIINAYTRETVENPIQKVINSGNIAGIANHTILKAKDGTEHQIADSAAPIRDAGNTIIGVVMVFRDITEEYRKNRRIKESKEFLDAAFNSIQDGISVLNPDMTIRYINPVMEKRHQANMPLIGKKCYVNYHNRNTPCDSCPVLRCIKSGKTEVETMQVYSAPNDTFKWREIFSYPIKDSETKEITGAVEFVRDITKQKETEEQLIEAKEKAEESDRLKSAFLANMSHEIRTPLNAIMGFTQLLGKGDITPEKQKNYLDIIQNKSNILLQLINDLIDLSKIDANQISLKYETFSLNSLLDEIFSSFKVKMDNENKSHLSFTLQKGLEDTQSYIFMDNKRLEQIFSNLLSNAIKFTKEGSIEYGYEKRGEDTLLFYVTDTGMGISDAKKGKIFQRFDQGDDSIAKKFGGTGLGVPISKSLTEILGGKMWFDSRENKGTTFYFTLPYIKGETKGTEHKSPASETAWEDKAILLIEDDPFSMQLIQEILEPTGVKLFQCETGQEGVNTFKENTIDLILVDIKLPDIDGLEVTRKIRALQAGKNVPVIAQTAHAMDGDAKKSKDAGCDDHISKPLNTDTLIEKLRTAL